MNKHIRNLFVLAMLVLAAWSCKDDDEDSVAVASVDLNVTTKALAPGEEFTLTATINPSNATNKSIEWSSSDTKVATVNADGHVNTIAAGIAAITAKTQDGAKTATCAVTVSTAVSGITLNVTTKTLVPGDHLTLEATVAPANADNKEVMWSSSNEEIATVDDKGLVMAVAAGTTTITTTTVDGAKTATCTVTVGIPVSGVALTLKIKTLVLGNDITLAATVAPANADNKEVMWSSSNDEVATVDDGGLVTSLASGTTVITATTVDGGKTATCTVTVVAQYAFGKVSNTIRTAVYGDYPGGYQFWLYPTVEDDGIFEGANEFIRIDIPREMMGSSFTLTEENPYDWDWRVAYRDNATDMTYEGAGFRDGMGDVDSGTLYAVKTGDDAFDVIFDVVFTDGKRLKGRYAGKLVKNNDFYGNPVRKAAEARRGNF